VKGVFRGSGTTLLRESIGNATFFSVYEYMRYRMHSYIKPASSDYSHLIEIGIGVVTGGVGGVAVSILKTKHVLFTYVVYN
jgi:solute carrier family 25 carnitine/acylcarnitine transporter 20/29